MEHSLSTIVICGRGLRRFYKRGIETVKALDGVDIDIHRGEMVSILGPSGSGKTTLVNILSCLDAPTEGELSLNHIPLTGFEEDQLAKARRGTLGFVFQKFHLLPTLTVAENVELPMLFLGRPADRATALAVLANVGLANRMDHLPKELSGGEMQRGAVARALITNPTVLIADEPTGNLDKTTGEAIFSLLQGLVKNQGLTVIITTHNLALGYRAARIITLEDGKIVKEEGKS